MFTIRPRHLLPLVALTACVADPTARMNGPAAPPAARASSAYDATEPHFLKTAAGAPSIANPIVEFWAKVGEDRTATMVYHALPGHGDSTTFLALRVRPKSLWLRPDGTPFVNGDSIKITITLVDAEHMVVDCQPAGLRFSLKDPARLKLSFRHADDDVNDDGTVNQTDKVLTRTFAIWRHETPDSPWILVPSVVSDGIEEVEAGIPGFTGYAILY